MSDSLFDAVGELVTDLGDGFIPSPILKLGYYGVRAAFGRGSGKTAGGPVGPEAVLNEMVRSGRFEEAETFFRTLNLPRSVESEVLGQIREARARQEKALGWHAEIHALLQRGDVVGAVRYVGGLDLPSDQRDALVAAIRTAVADQEERKRQVAEWNRELGDLLSRGKVRKAKKYVRALPIPDRAKEGILAHLPG